MLCREWTLVKSREGTLYAEPLKCRCWHCEYCRPIRVNQLKALARSGHPNTFLTLTVNPKKGHTPAERARSLAKAWRLLRLRAMRKYNYEKLPFLAVFEKTKRGEPHLHILLRTPWLSQKWLSRQMAELTGAPIVDIRRVKGEKQAAAYVAKYLGKDPHAFEGCKRYWRSQDYAPPQEADVEGRYIPPDTVCIVRKEIETYVRHAAEDGFDVRREEDGSYSLRYALAERDWHQEWQFKQWTSRERPH